MTYFSGSQYQPFPSISHYYYSRMSAWFVIVVSTLGIFLLAYQYQDRQGKYPIGDFILSSFAGIAGLLLLLFPTDYISNYGMTGDLGVGNVGKGFHYMCAAVFLVSLALMMIFLFTKSDPAEKLSPSKKARRLLYVFLGLVMIVAMTVMFVGGFYGKIPNYDQMKLTFWMETVAVVSFGIGWLVKGMSSTKVQPEDSKS